MNEELELPSLNDHEPSQSCGGSDPCPSKSEAAAAASIPTDEGGLPDRDIDNSIGTDGSVPDLSEAQRASEKAVLPADPPSDPDPDPSDAHSDGASADELKDLRREIDRLRGLLSDRRMENARREVAHGEFATLYPDVAFEDLPDDVLLDIGRGMPVSAAYALSERRRVLREQNAARTNRANRSRSAGALGHAETDLFSPDEVRAMSPSEVRANLEKIRRSMQSWG